MTNVDENITSLVEEKYCKDDILIIMSAFILNFSDFEKAIVGKKTKSEL